MTEVPLRIVICEDDEKLAALVEKCLTEGWSREKLRTFVDRTIAGKPVPVDDESTKKSAARGVAWNDGDRFIVVLGRVVLRYLEI